MWMVRVSQLEQLDVPIRSAHEQGRSSTVPKLSLMRCMLTNHDSKHGGLPIAGAWILIRPELPSTHRGRRSRPCNTVRPDSKLCVVCRWTFPSTWVSGWPR